MSSQKNKKQLKQSIKDTNIIKKLFILTVIVLALSIFIIKESQPLTASLDENDSNNQSQSNENQGNQMQSNQTSQGNNSQQSQDQDLTPPEVVITSPSQTIYNTTIINLSFNVVEDSSFECYYSVNQEQHSIQNCEQENQLFLTLSEGCYNLTVLAIDEYNNSGSQTVQFCIDVTPPVVEQAFPSGVLTTSNVEIEVHTNENAYCKLSSQDLSFNQMQQLFSITGTMIHKQLLNLEQGHYVYYVKCKDVAGNAMDDSIVIEFDVNLAPTASIDIKEAKLRDDIYLLKKSTYKIELVTSEPVNQPTLYYMFNDDTAKKQISLIGSETHWVGYLIVQDVGEKIGSIYFTAKDYSGVETRDKVVALFMIDTNPPGKVLGVKYNVTNDYVVIQWQQPSDCDGCYYNVYRSTSPNVLKTDFYKQVCEPKILEFAKDLASYSSVYYYKISALDKAGNEGLLSDEIAIHVGLDNNSNNDLVNGLSPELKLEINNTVKKLDALQLDIDWALKNLESIHDETLRKAMTTLGLLASTRDAKNKIIELARQAQDLYNVKLDSNFKPEDVKQGLKNILKKAEAYKKQVCINVDVTSSLEFKQKLSQPEMSLVAIEFAKRYGFDQEVKEQFLKNISLLMQDIDVYVEAFVVKVKYLDNREEEKLLVFKNIQSSKVLEDVIVVETIPKAIATHASDVNFLQSPKVLKDDPMVYWRENSLLNKELSYVSLNTDIESLHYAKTVVVPNPELFLNHESFEGLNNPVSASSATGFSIRMIPKHVSVKNLVFGLGIVLILGLLIYYLRISSSSPGLSSSSASPSVLMNNNFSMRSMQSSSVQPSVMAGMAGQELSLILKRLREAHVLANKFHVYGLQGFNQVKSIYNDCVSKVMQLRYKISKYFGKFLDKHVDKQFLELEYLLNMLYAKILILEKLARAHDFVDGKNLAGLSFIIPEILNELDIVEDVEFQKSVLQALDYFKQVLFVNDTQSLHNGLHGWGL
ncbi:hypothetical protein J7L02_01185 [Candidatus Woesearchaeota archaeon]|nr:hypothetical protein [Candidatus Woesearchaeota archaeon]